MYKIITQLICEHSKIQLGIVASRSQYQVEHLFGNILWIIPPPPTPTHLYEDKNILMWKCTEYFSCVW